MAGQWIEFTRGERLQKSRSECYECGLRPFVFSKHKYGLKFIENCFEDSDKLFVVNLLTREVEEYRAELAENLICRTGYWLNETEFVIVGISSDSIRQNIIQLDHEGKTAATRTIYEYKVDCAGLWFDDIQGDVIINGNRYFSILTRPTTTDFKWFLLPKDPRKVTDNRMLTINLELDATSLILEENDEGMVYVGEIMYSEAMNNLLFQFTGAFEDEQQKCYVDRYACFDLGNVNFEQADEVHVLLNAANLKVLRPRNHFKDKYFTIDVFYRRHIPGIYVNLVKNADNKHDLVVTDLLALQSFKLPDDGEDEFKLSELHSIYGYLVQIEQDADFSMRLRPIYCDKKVPKLRDLYRRQIIFANYHINIDPRCEKLLFK